MAEYKLSYTAADIDEKLGKVSQLSEDTESLFANVESLQTDVDVLNEGIVNKQNKLSGSQGQIVGFDGDGNAIAQDNPQSDWNQNNESAIDFIKNRTHYTEVIENDIAGMEFSMPTSGGNIPHGHNIPFALGQVWGLKIDNGQPSEVEVRQAEDGTLHVGGMDIGPYDITSTNANFLSDWLHVANPKSIALIGVSGAYPTTEIHHLDHKYIKDMYYEEDVEFTIANNISVTFEEAEPIFNPFQIEIIEGNIYTVTWDGITYECTAYVAPGPNSPSIGNGSIGEASGGSDEPFFITVYSGNVMLFGSETGTHTISISTVHKNIKTIDPKYIKDMYYEEVGETTLVEATHTFNTNSDWANDFALKNCNIGDTVTVYWNDTPYICVVGGNSLTDAYVGNSKLFAPNGIDTGEPFYIVNNSPSCYVCCTELGEVNLKITTTHNDIHYLDSKYIKDMYCEKDSDVNIVGTEIRLNTTTDGGYAGVEILHNTDIPFELGQVWSCKCELSSATYELTVQEADDGTLYIGDPDVTAIPFYVTNDIIKANSGWVDMMDAYTLYMTGISNRVIVNKIDQKYLPEVAIAQPDWNALEGEAGYIKNKPLVSVGGDTLTWDGNTEGLASVMDAMYRVSGVTPEVEDFANGAYIYREAGADSAGFNIASEEFIEFAPGAIMIGELGFIIYNEAVGVDFGGFSFPESGIYLPCFEGMYISILTIYGYTGFDSEKIAPSHLYQPDWEQRDAGKPDYIKNKPIVCQPDYNQTDKTQPDFIKNRQFGDFSDGGDTLTWDGNTEERETTCFLDSYILVKVHSGALPAIDESHTITAKLKIGSDEVTEICTITADGDYSIIQFRDGYVIGLIIHEDIPFINCTPIPSKGVYFTYDFAHPESTSLLYQVASLTVDGYTGFPSIKKLDKNYLPMDDIFNEIMSRIPRAEEASF